MRKMTQGLVTAAAGLVIGATFGAAPALAGPQWIPPGHLLGYYDSFDDCSSYATSLILWDDDYACDFRPARFARPYALIIERPVLIRPGFDYFQPGFDDFLPGGGPISDPGAGPATGTGPGTTPVTTAPPASTPVTTVPDTAPITSPVTTPPAATTPVTSDPATGQPAGTSDPATGQPAAAQPEEPTKADKQHKKAGKQHKKSKKSDKVTITATAPLDLGADPVLPPPPATATPAPAAPNVTLVTVVQPPYLPFGDPCGPCF